MRFSPTFVAAVGLFSAVPSAFATITITGPSPKSYWVQGATNLITWTSTQGDPSPVSITVTNSNSSFLNGPFAIAENVDIKAQSFTVTNVTLNQHDGYLVNFVNGSNPSQMYAQSSAFSLMSPGTPQATQATVSGSSASATGTSPAGSGSASTSASASGASSTPSKSSSSLRSFDSSLMTLAPMLGVSTLMSIVVALATL